MTDHRADVDRYVSGVLDGSIVAGSLVKAACRRHVTDLESGDKRGLTFDDAAANRAIQFFGCLSHTTGEYAGQPFIPRLWQKFILWNLFGWKRADEFRRFRKAFVSLARGNGKSPVAAAIANLCFVADEPVEQRAEIYSVATKEKQARIVWEEAKQQIAKSTSPSLRKHVVRQTKNMHVPATMSKFEPLGSDSDTNDGWNIHCAILDELHAWGNHHRGLLNVIETAMGKRRQPLRVMITTAGNDESQIWIEEYDWAVAVVNGQQQADDLFVYIAEVDREEPCPKCSGADGGCEYCEKTGRIEVDVLDERYWPQANPMLNEPEPTVKIDELRSYAARAKVQPAKLADFRRYYANQMIASYDKEYPPELWMRGAKPVAIKSGMPCHGGFDRGDVSDWSAFWLVFPIAEVGEYHTIGWAFTHRETRLPLDQEPFASFVRNGRLLVNDGSAVDPEAYYEKVTWAQKEYELRSIAFDINNSREFGIQCLNGFGIPTYAFPQTCAKYHEPMEGVSSLLMEGKFVHGNDSLLNYAAGNVVARKDSMNHRMPHKPRSKGKIDPIVAMLMAFSECKFSEQQPLTSVYERENRGFIEIG